MALHGRTAAQLYSGQADWSAHRELKEAVTSIPVLGNGDIWEASDALAMLDRTGCDGVVVGRGCLGRPWLFGELAAALAGRPVPAPPTTAAVVPVMLEHAELLAAWFGPDKGIREFRKHAGWYLKGYPVGSPVRARLNQVGSHDELAELVGGLPDVALPADALRLARGHTQGPQAVAVPAGWLDDPWDDALPSADADTTASGG